MSVRLSFRKEQIGSDWTDFHEILYLRICCWLVLRISNASQQHHRWTLPEAVVTVVFS